MNSHQISVNDVSEQDRCRLRINRQGGEASRLWTARRLVLTWMPQLRQGPLQLLNKAMTKSDWWRLTPPVVDLPRLQNMDAASLSGPGGTHVFELSAAGR